MITHFGTARRRNDERFVDEGFENSHNLGRRERARLRVVRIGADVGGRGQAPPTCEDRQPAEKALLFRVEQVVAPVDQRAHCLLPRQSGSTGTGQNSKAFVEIAHELLRRERGDARRGKLDGERNTVKTPANLSDGADVSIG